MGRVSNYDFSFKGISASSKGVLTVSRAVITHTVMNGDKKAVPGKDGFLFIPDGSYAPVTVKIDIAIPDKTKVNAALEWLQGRGNLILSDEPTLYREAMVLTAYTRNPYTKHLEGEEISLTFTCQPWRYLVNETSTDFTMNGTLSGNGYRDASPLVVCRGNGDAAVTINGNRINMTLTASVPLYLDCDAGLAYVFAGDELVYMGTAVEVVDEWFTLLPSGNTNTILLEGSISKATITPRWRFV